MKTATDVNSTVNQEIKGRFVGREVYCCFSYEMDECLKKGVVEYEDIENMYVDADECYEDYGYESADDMRDDGADIQEIYEWWIVSEYLYGKLKAKGHPVLEWGNNYYWGRCTTGQAILLDGVISEICQEMEILEGQSYSWANDKS